MAIIISTCSELNSDQKQQLQSKLIAKFGSEATFEYLIDQKLGLGINITVNGVEYNYSLQHQTSHIIKEMLS